jgi:hypothetical protein
LKRFLARIGVGAPRSFFLELEFAMPVPHHSFMFIPSIQWPPRLPLAHRLANLLLSWDVQSISFTFGSVVVMPDGFRAVANALVAGDIGISTDPTKLRPGEHARYEYDRLNLLMFRTDNILDTKFGRAVAVHECKHVISDIKGKNVARRSEEAAAFLAESWYLRNCDGAFPRPIDTPKPIWDIAHDMANRAALEGRPVRVTGSEIQTCRIEIARIRAGGGYANDHMRMDGV